jgi:hypothetical protein
MSRQLAYTRAFIDRAASDDEAIRFVGATEGEKGDGIALKMDGAQLDRYQANPIFGYGHRYYGRDSLPIGKSKKTWVDSKRLMFDVVFDRKDEFAVTVENKYRDGYLNAVSIGFSVTEWEDPKSDYFTGGVATGWELFELSSVPLPMDPNAVVASGRAVDSALMDSLRSLLDRLDAGAIDQLRRLLDAVGSPDAPRADPPPPGHDGGRPPAGRSLERARQLARLAGI